MAVQLCQKLPWRLAKQLKFTPTPFVQHRQSQREYLTTSSHTHNADTLDFSGTSHSTRTPPPAPTIPPPSSFYETHALRLPRNIQAAYLRPLRRPPTHGVPVCTLQLRSYSARNLSAMADFCLRAAYYLSLPARGPVPLPRITQRWTVPRANFAHKKSQENFERVTLRRAMQIVDADVGVVRVWLAFVRRHAYYGVGMKANLWEWEGLDGAERMGERGTEGVRRERERFGRWEGLVKRTRGALGEGEEVVRGGKRLLIGMRRREERGEVEGGAGGGQE